MGLIRFAGGRTTSNPPAGNENPNANYLLTGVQQPPHDGETYDYNDWRPGAVGFMSAGEWFECPVFGSRIWRVTEFYTASPSSANDFLQHDSYAKHQMNADGTMMYSKSPASGSDGFIIIDTSDMSVLHTNQPTGIAPFEVHWDATDPNIYYYFSGTSLMQRDLSGTPSSSTKKNFGSTMQGNGGSLNIQSADGRYFVVRYNNTAKVWDSISDTIYTGQTPTMPGGGWVSITPSGNHLCTGGNSHTSYPLNHTTDTVGTGTEYWNLCGDHAVLISPDDGNDYAVVIECNSTDGIYVMDVTTDVSAMTDTQQRNAAQSSVVLGEWTVDYHLSAVSKGAYKNYVFIDTEELGGGDNFNVDPGVGWYQYAQEIIAMEVLTGQIYRLAHHRSRNIDGNLNYYGQPRLSCAWDGSKVIWGSNFNIDQDIGGAQYSDYYMIKDPIGSALA